MEEKKESVKKSLRGMIVLFFIAFILFVVSFLFYFKWMTQTPNSGASAKKLVEVTKGETTFEIASDLQNKGIIKCDWIFFLHAKIKAKTLETGIYEIGTNLSMDDVFNIISNGETKIVKITIPEGYRVEQIGQVLAEKQLVDFDNFVKKAKPYEGKLFPDTYYFSPEDSIEDILHEMNQNFVDRTADLNMTNEDLIIASIVEREASKDEERPLIAGIYKNRLNISMKLQADPTVQYGKDSLEVSSLAQAGAENFKYWKAITSKDYLTVNSVYNTYIIPGLPPAPICNPGIKSIRATINYEKSDYLYFLQSDGQIYPAKTLEEHNQNRAKVFGVQLK